MSFEMTKNLKNTSLSMLSWFLDSGGNAKHVNTHPPIITADLPAV